MKEFNRKIINKNILYFLIHLKYKRKKYEKSEIDDYF